MSSLILAAGLAFANGGQQAPAASSNGQPKTLQNKDITVGFSIGDLTNPVWVTMANAMKAEGKKIGINLIIKDYHQDPATQANDMDNFIQMKCQTIIIHPMDAASMIPYVKKCHDAGIKVIAYDTDLPGRDVFGGLDNTIVGKAIGKMAGEWVNKALGGKANVAVFAYDQIPAIKERTEGEIAGLTAECPNAKIVKRVTAGLIEQGVKEGENLIQSNPDCNVIIGLNDAGLLGAYQAYSAKGWQHKKDLGLFGCDMVADAVRYLEDPDSIYRGTCLLDTATLGVKMVDEAVQLAKGEHPKDIYATPIMITKDNVRQHAQKAQ
jgi:ribose transport system substrate-binding protein